MSTKDEIKAELRDLRDALTERQQELGLGALAARWSGAMLRCVGLGPARRRNAWRDLADEPTNGASVKSSLENAASKVRGARASTASAALKTSDRALDDLDAILT